MLEKVNLAQKFERFAEYWDPHIAGELNDSYVKLAKLKGEFEWHQHDDEDELFLVVKGHLTARWRCTARSWRVRDYSAQSGTSAGRE